MKRVKLSKGKFALVDNEDYDRILKRVSRFKKRNEFRQWYANNPDSKGRTFYALSWNGEFHERMHRFVLGLSREYERSVDHINGNGLDNRKSNLRVCTKSQNMANSGKRPTSKNRYKGVFKIRYGTKNVGMFRVFIIKEGKTYDAGLFEKAREGALAYNELNKKLNGEFAYQNYVN